MAVRPSGAQRAGGGVTIGALVSGGTNNRVLYIDNTGALAVSAALQFDGGTNRMTVGALTSQGSIIGSNGLTAGIPDFAFTGDPDTGLYSPGANQIGLAIGGAAGLTVGVAAGSTPDADIAFGVGRALIDSRGTDVAYFSHRDQSGTTSYAVYQDATGATRINCASGKTCRMLHSNSQRFLVDSTGIAFYSTAAGVAQQTITGSKGANAALASLLTALAATGLIIDSTT